MSVCHNDRFLATIDEGLARYMLEVEPTAEFCRTAHNLRLIAKRIVDCGGFPDGTRMQFGFEVDPTNGDVGQTTFEFARKGMPVPHTLSFDLSDRWFSGPECFRLLVQEMQNLAVSMREIKCPCN